MINENQESEYNKNGILNVLIGLLIGSLVGAITMLLLAPQSGEETRQQIQDRGIELRDRTTGMVGDAMADGRQKAIEALRNGQTLVAEQLDHISKAAHDGKKAVESS